MSILKGRAKLNTVFLVVLSMMLQIVSPAMQGVYAAKAEEALNIDVRLNGSTAYVDWKFTLDPDNRVNSGTVDGGFTLDDEDEINGKLEDKGTVIGDYSITKDGNITLNIDKGLYDVFDEGDEPENSTTEESNTDEPKDETDIQFLFGEDLRYEDSAMSYEDSVCDTKTWCRPGNQLHRKGS